MKFGVCSLVVGGSVLVLLGVWRNSGVVQRAPRFTGANVARARMAQPRAAEDYGKLPLSFEVNQGQTDGHVKFLARGQGYTLFLTSQEAVLALHKSEGKRLPKEGAKATEGATWSGELRPPSTTLQMKLVGANSKASVNGEDELPGKSNYFIGNDPKKWRTNIPTYAKVRVEDVYPGVDLVYYGNQGQLEYDFVVQPEADASAIKLALTSRPFPEGKRSRNSIGSSYKSVAKIDADGDLVVQADGGEVRFQMPVVYQPVSADSGGHAAERIPIDGHYAINPENEVAFSLGEYDRTKPLVIDPVLAYSTYLSGSGFNVGSAITVDSSGNAYVTGTFNNQPDICGLVCEPFPTTPGAFEASTYGWFINLCGSSGLGCEPFPTTSQTSTYGWECAFVTKINAEGTALVYSTWLGGSGAQSGNGIAVDSSGNAYVAGTVSSRDFPTTANAFQATTPSSVSSAFVTKLDADGSALVYSTYLGGSGANHQGDWATGIAIDGTGNAYVTGYASSHNFPTVNPIQGTNRSASYSNAFVAKLNSTGSALVYSTYLGGSLCGTYCWGDGGAGIAVDGAGSAYVTGTTYSSDFPTTPNALQGTLQGSLDAFVTKLSPDGSSWVYSTYLGGSSDAEGHGIALDISGHAHVTGRAGTGFPTTASAFQGAAPGGEVGGFVTKLNTDGSALVYSTYLGGTNGPSGGNSIAVDSSGDTYVTGITGATDFPAANAIQGTNHGELDAFVTELTPDGSGLVYSTYLGGHLNDFGLGIAVDASGNAYLTGTTESRDFPVDSPIQPAFIGNTSAFESKISPLIVTTPTTP